MVRLAVLVLVGCGRINFAPQGGAFGDGSVGENEIAVRVVTDEDGTTTPGLSVVGADVIIDGTDRMRTDDSGGVRFTTAANANIVVVFPRSDGWRVYTLDAVPPGTGITLGGYAQVLTPILTSMQFTVPAHPMATSYRAFIPTECAAPSTTSSTTLFTHEFREVCDGRTLPVTVLASDAAGALSWFDTTVRLTAGSAATLTGSYTSLPTYSVTLTNLSLSSVTGLLVALATSSDADVRYVGNTGPVTPTGSMMTVMPRAPMLADVLSVNTNGNSTVVQQFYSTLDLQRITPGTLTLAYDASTALPLYDNLQLGADGRSVQWSSSTPGPSPQMVVLTARIITSTLVTWTAYLPGAAASAQFPALPSELIAADPAGGTFWSANATAYLAPGATNLYSIDVVTHQVLAQTGRVSSSTAGFLDF